MNVIDGYVASIEAPIKVGPKVKATLSSNVLTDSNHNCNACISGTIDVELEIKADVWICNKKHNSEERHYELGKRTFTWHITDFYFSITHQEFGWGLCPYIKAKNDPNTGNDDFTGNENVGDIIKFGSYPQSRVTDEVLIDGLNSQSYSWKSYNYYTGTGDLDDGNMQPSDYMKYADIVFNGNKYRAVTFSQYRPYYIGNTSSSLNSHQDENGYYTNRVYYFKYEPLQWRVLDASTGLVMCNNVIDSQAFNDYFLLYDDEYYSDSSKSNYASDYGKSSIRNWLNSDFYNTAFSTTQQSRIKYNQTIDSKSTYRDDYDGTSTYDNNVFLLSYWDVINSNYGFNSSYSAYDTARQLKSTDYAQIQGCYKSTSTNYNGNSWWRLRSPYFSYCAAYISTDGYAYSGGDVDGSGGGIVPALILKKTVSDGTDSDDSTFTGTESTGTIINFGSYPQSKITDDSLISKLNKETKQWESYEYYIGTGAVADGQMQPSGYMKYADIVFNGNKYRAVTFSQYRPNCTGYTSSASNSEQDDNGYYVNNIYYFKYEPLQWRVLDANEGLVMCNRAIDSQAYQNFVFHNENETSTDEDYYNSKSCTNYASDWETSSIREWLNNDFFNTAFTSSEKSQIGTSYLENKSTYSSTYDSANTFDKIFLLSYWDAKNPDYGFNSDNLTNDIAKQIKATDYANCQGIGKYPGIPGCSWWLRTNFDSVYELAINNDYIWENNIVFCDGYGVVPAFKFNTKSTITTSSASELKLSSSLGTAAEIKKSEITYSDCEAGCEYILLNVLEYTEDFTLTTENLLYIDQLTADENGVVSTTMFPRENTESSKILLIGDFGNDDEIRVLNPDITFVSDGEKVLSKTLNIGDYYGELPELQKENCIFAGWYNDTSNKITESSIVDTPKSHSINAYWINCDDENKFLYGNNLLSIKMSDLSVAVGCTNNPYNDKKISTGQIFEYNNIQYSVVVYGDTNCDGWYDGTDAMLVNCIVNGMLTREQVGEAVWTAADCNHDGVIDDLDVALLNEAGLLLSKIDQTKSQEELKISSVYQEYLSLIDQSPTEKETEKPTTQPEKPATGKKTFADLFKTIIDVFINYFKSLFKITK